MKQLVKNKPIMTIAFIVVFAMLVSLVSFVPGEVQAAAKKPAIAKNVTTVLNGKQTLKIKKNGYKITKVLSVKSTKKAVAKANASKSKVTVYGIKAGKAKITVKVKARKGKKKKTFKLISNAAVKDPSATLSSKQIDVGDTALVKLSNIASGAEASYSSSDPSVAVVNKGKIDAKYQGKTSIKVKVTLKKTKYAKKKTKTLNAGTLNVKLNVDKLIGKMTLEQKISQMIMPSMRSWDGEKVQDLSKYPKLSSALRKHQYGGVILFGQNINETEQTTRLVSGLQENNAKGASENGSYVIPYMTALDQEGGAVNRLSIGTRGTGSMALGATGDKAAENTERTAEVLGKEMSSVGFNVNLGPCIDVIDDLSDPGWSTRIFSDDPQTVSDLGLAFKAGMDKNNVITTYKHFPGAGDGSDYPTAIGLTRNELQEKGLYAYKQAVDNGAEMIMISATTFPNIDVRHILEDGVTKGFYPASASKLIVSEMLRGGLGFDGVVITDALEMDQFIYEPTGFVPGSNDNKKLFNGKKYTVGHDLQIAREVINAGCDILLLPTDMVDDAAVEYYDKYITGIEKLVKDGVIKEKRINESVKRILTLKQKRAVFNTDTKGEKTEQAVSNAKKIVGSKENHDVEKQIAKQAVTMLKNDGKVIPVSEKAIKVFIICNSDSDSNPVMYALEQMKEDKIISQDALIDNRITAVKEGDENADMQIVIDRFNKNEQGKLVNDNRVRDPMNESDLVICLSKMLPLSSPGEVASNANMKDVVGSVINDAKAANKKVILLSTNLPSDAAFFKDNADAIVCSYLSSGFGVDPTAHTSGSENVGAFNANVPAAIYAIFGGTRFAGTLPINIPKINNDDTWSDDEILYHRGESL